MYRYYKVCLKRWQRNKKDVKNSKPIVNNRNTNKVGYVILVCHEPRINFKLIIYLGLNSEDKSNT